MISEVRIGYATIDCIFRETINYIKAHTNSDGKYFGNPRYIINAYNMREHLKQSEGDVNGKFESKKACAYQAGGV